MMSASCLPCETLIQVAMMWLLLARLGRKSEPIPTHTRKERLDRSRSGKRLGGHVVRLLEPTIRTGGAFGRSRGPQQTRRPG
jgi:hypothetical protein